MTELENEKAYALELQKALTGLTGGGSEFFVRHGDGYRADISACVTRVRERQNNTQERLIEAVTCRNALAEALTWALAELRGQTRYENPQQAFDCFAKADAALASLSPQQVQA